MAKDWVRVIELSEEWGGELTKLQQMRLNYAWKQIQ